MSHTVKIRYVGLPDRLRSERGSVGWTASIVRERQEALRNRDGAIIAIVAGSNGLFGIDSDMIANRTGIRSINASSHAELAWSFIDYSILSRMRSGDIAILPLEHIYLRAPREPELNNLTVAVAHSIGLGYFFSLSLQEKEEYLRLLRPSFMWDQIWLTRENERATPVTGYWAFRSTVTGNIDLSNARPNHPGVIEQARQRTVPSSIPEPHRVCASIQRLTNKGVRVIGTPPNIYLQHPLIEASQQFLPKMKAFYERCGASWLADANGGHQQLDSMLDTPYHLNQKGRQLRTIQLLEKLCTLVDCH